jgi:hypothetical protein
MLLTTNRRLCGCKMAGLLLGHEGSRGNSIYHEALTDVTKKNLLKLAKVRPCPAAAVVYVLYLHYLQIEV